MSARRVWTEEEVIALGVKCTVEQAGSILGLGGKDKAYKLLRAGEFPVPTFTVNNRTWVPMKPVRELLGIEPNGHHQTEDSPLGFHTRLTQGGNGEGDPRLGSPSLSVPTTPTPQKERIIHEPL